MINDIISSLSFLLFNDQQHHHHCLCCSFGCDYLRHQQPSLLSSISIGHCLHHLIYSHFCCYLGEYGCCCCYSSWSTALIHLSSKQSSRHQYHLESSQAAADHRRLAVSSPSPLQLLFCWQWKVHRGSCILPSSSAPSPSLAALFVLLLL